MRMGTFLLGGIVGVLAVSYMNRNNGMWMSNLANAGQSAGNMVTKARSMFTNKNTGMSQSAQTAQPQQSQYAPQVQTEQSNSQANLSGVKEIVNKDPELKSKVNEILADNPTSTSSYRMQ